MMANNNMQQQINPAQQNSIARQLIVSQSVERLQSIYSNSVNPENQNVININPRNVGLIKGFFVDVTFDVTNSGANVATLSPPGPANLLSQIKFDDLQNNTRIQTTGWHLHFINSVRNRRPFGLCETLDSSPIGYGNNVAVITAPPTIAALAANQIVTMRYYVPISYSNEDLRGAIYAGVVNATMQLQLTLNAASFCVDPATSSGNSAVYTSTAPNFTINSANITVYQHYLDQLPMGNQGPILPALDIQTIYELKNTTVTGLSADQDYTIPYANFRTFLSTMSLYDDVGLSSLTGLVNYWSLRSANFTDIFKYSLEENALLSRLQIGVDFPDFVSYFDHRNKPINTIQYGNMELVINASAPTPTTRMLVGYEDFAMINTVSGAGSLPAGG